MAGNDIDRETKASNSVQITGPDEAYQADVIRLGGVNRLGVDANISSINVPLGKDPLPDTFFQIDYAGAIGDTIRFQLAATSIDSSSPDRDLPAIDFTYTLVAADVGDEQQLARNFVDALNASPQSGAAYIEAEFINDLRAIVYISSTIFSLNGEAVERPVVGDVSVTTTGTTVTSFFSSDHEKFVSRPKEVSLARDPNNPHRLGVQNVSGTVRLRAQAVEQILKEYAKDSGGSTLLNVNGQGAPVSFTINSNAVGFPDKLVESIKFIVSDGNIKVNSGSFLGNNAPLSNGILVRFYKNGVLVYEEPPILDTTDLLGQWSNTAAENTIISQSAGDYLESTFSLVETNLQFLLEAGKNDYIEILVQDNLSSVDRMRVLFGGFLED